ncbi:MAG TPA: hypothetical protein VMS64_35740 [Candidatus Methylomirabilis sp.]|nr:hypothetical protein [Candidatus Methylomirabilis sp.]
MALKQDLKALQARLESGRPPEVVATMHRAVEELRASGAPGRVLKVGDRAPDFVLPNAEERLVDSRALLASGPLIVTFYRGRW